jgi:DNA repair protein RecN (Recombination protein N)
MEKSTFEVNFADDYDISNIEQKFTEFGADNVEFLFSANAGEPVKPLNKVVSGGELSRFMLAFKCVVSGTDKFKTFVFDEIDTGIGGNVGNILGRKLYKISNGNQVFCITHLAQIACFADSHYKVQKFDVDNKTMVNVNSLDLESRYVELDRMIGGGSEYSKLHAIELINESNNFKNQI